MKYKIVSDSTANIICLENVDFQSVPLKINTSLNEYTDDENVDILKMVNELKEYKGKSSTACPSPESYIEAFGDADRVFCTTITSKLSGSYNSARIAKEEYENTNPDKKVFVIDTLSAGPEITLIIEKLQELILRGMEYEEICNTISEYSKKTHLIFSLESLTNLANNGRVSQSVARLTGILGIRLIGKAQEGTLQPTNKSRGEKKAIDVLFENMKKNGYNGGKVIIAHCENENGAIVLQTLIKTQFPHADIKIGINRALCSYYAEKGGILVGFEGSNK